MDVREKMVELLAPTSLNFEQAVYLADYLVKNGVTVQEWISVNDKLPPYNHDVLVYRPNMAMKFLVDNYEGHYGEDDDEWYEGWAKYGTDIHGNHVITHWAYLPKPPKGE